MKNHSLTIIASGLDTGNLDYADRFFEAGYDDSTISSQKVLFVLEFDREAETFEDALITAIRDVKKAGATVERIEPDHLVSAADIATRTGVTLAAVSLYTSGKRGDGFPSPIARVTTDSPLWDWPQVAAWLVKHDKISSEQVEEAFAIRDMNRAIIHAHHSRTEAEKRFEAELVAA
jgi:predicted transcriptional regulator